MLNNLNKKVLPLYKPNITTYHYHAVPLSIMPEGDKKDIWLYNNYIQLEIPPLIKGTDYTRMDFYFPYSVWKSCPLLFYQRIAIDVINKGWNYFYNFIIDCINLGYYIYLFVDQYYIPKTRSYRRYHFVHDIFIYGYDLEQQVVYAKEYLEHNIYGDTVISFEEIQQAFDFKDRMNLNEVELLSYKEHDVPEYKIDTDYIKNSLSDYLNGTNTYRCHYYRRVWEMKNIYSFGINVYNNIISYITFDLPKAYSVDPRLLSAFYEHKRLMLSRIKYLGINGYLENSGYIYKRYRDIERVSLLIKNLLIKYNFSKKPEILSKVLDKIEWVREEEKVVLTILRDNILSERVYVSAMSEKYIGCYEKFLVCKKDEPLLIDITVPLYNQKIKKLVCEEQFIDNVEICFDVPKDLIKVISHRKGTFKLLGYDVNDELIAAYHIKSVEPGFITSLNKMERVKGLWHEENEGMVGEGGGDNFYLINERVKNFIFSADICINNGIAVGLVFRAEKNFSNFYCANIDVNGFVKIFRPKDEIKVAEYKIESNRIYHMMVKVIDSNIIVYIDDHEIININDYKITSEGYLGLNVYAGVGCFQNVNLVRL